MQNGHDSQSGLEVAEESSVSSQGGKVRPILIVPNTVYGGATRDPNGRQRGVTFALPSDDADPFEKEDGKCWTRVRLLCIFTKHETSKVV